MVGDDPTGHPKGSSNALRTKCRAARCACFRSVSMPPRLGPGVFRTRNMFPNDQEGPLVGFPQACLDCLIRDLDIS